VATLFECRNLAGVDLFRLLHFRGEWTFSDYCILVGGSTFSDYCIVDHSR